MPTEVQPKEGIARKRILTPKGPPTERPSPERAPDSVPEQQANQAVSEPSPEPVPAPAVAPVAAPQEPVRESAPAPGSAVITQNLRDIQPKKFGPSKLNTQLGQDFDRFPLTAPADMSFEEALEPIAYAHVASLVAKDPLLTRRDRLGSIIELRGNGFYADLMINAIMVNNLGTPYGLDVTCIGPQIHPQTGKSWAVDCKTGLPWMGKSD